MNDALQLVRPVPALFSSERETAPERQRTPPEQRLPSKPGTIMQRSTLLPLSVLLTGVFLGPSSAALASSAQDFAGTWEGQLVLPFDSKPVKIRVGLEHREDDSWHGALDGDMLGPGLLSGKSADAGLQFDCDLGQGVNSFAVTLEGEAGMLGVLQYSGFPLSIHFQRTADTWDESLHIEVALPEERPTDVSLEGLPDFWLEPMEARILKSMDEGSFVGLALAVVIDGELCDARSWGWRDVERKLPVQGDTLFRWASISKSVTAVVATKLAAEKALDLDQDVCELVPEFPKKRHVVTTRLLLGHLGGLAHYQHMPKVTRVDYEDEFPFRDPVRAIDMFREAPLIHEPGSKYSYSTHGFVLVGAVVERTSERGYLGEVERLISEPLGMKSFEPDDPSAPRTQRTTGYRLTADGRLFDAGDSNVSWKLAGGGFQSTVSDMGRFGAGLCDEYFLDDVTRELLWTRQETTGGQQTDYGLGFVVENERDNLLVSHGGAQRRTRTFLLCSPQEGLAIALMCNTEGVNLEGIGRDLMGILRDQD